MLSLLGFLIPLPPELNFLTTPGVQFAINAAAWLAIAILFNSVLLRLLRYLTRQLPGELEDIVFAILRGPIVLLIVVYGAVNSLELLPLTTPVRDSIRLVTYTIVVITVTHILGRMIRDVLVYYGEKWARKSESRVDDVLVPVLNLFGPVILVLAAALIILPMWGVNVTSVLVGAGVIGLVLGLALQETLANVFAGLSLLVEAPFRTGDLITTPDGRLCEVERIGMRSTQLYAIGEHTIVYVPNRTLTGATLTNVTRPTLDQKFSLTVSLGPNADLATCEEIMRRIAVAHPGVLVENMEEKICGLRKQIAAAREELEIEGKNYLARDFLLKEIAYNERVIPRLELEGRVNRQLLHLQEMLREMIRGIKAREGKGLSEGERQEIYCNFLGPIDQEIETVAALAKEWTEAEDPWLDDSDYWNLRWLWSNRNEQLHGQWERVKKAVYHPDDRLEMRLDDVTIQMLDWIKREYKIVPGNWKNPKVSLQSFDEKRTLLELSYYVDNIRLEHEDRAKRVRTEIGRKIRSALSGEM